MVRALRQLAVICVVAAVLSLAACGGSGSSDSAAQGAITKAIVTSGTTDSATECTELETQRFVEQVSGDKGQEAIASCMKPGDNNADSIDVSSVAVDGDTATAQAAVTGGSFDGQTLKISLLNQDGSWKLDHIDGFAEFDKDKLVAAFSKGFSAPGSGVTADQAKCITTQLEQLDDDKIQAVILSGDRNQLVPVVAPCLTD